MRRGVPSLADESFFRKEIEVGSGTSWQEENIPLNAGRGYVINRVEVTDEWGDDSNGEATISETNL
jgi:hypothetical protein